MKNKHGFFSKVLTLCISVAMMLAVAAPALADYTAVGVTNDVPFNKYLVMDNDMPVPVANFTFEVTAGSARDASGTDPAIMAGPIVNGKPSIDSAAFSPTSTTYTTVQDGDVLTGTTFDPQTQKYAKVTNNVDFAGVTFSKPGIFRYVVKESGSAPGVTNDANTTRYMDVYVKDTGVADKPALEVYAVMFHNREEGIPTNADTTSSKNTGFTNRYTSYQVTLSKNVTGNQGNRDEYFKFVVEIDGSATTPATPQGVQYAVTSTGTLGTAVTGDINPNASTLTTGDDGKATGTYYIKHGQTITIKGLTAGTKYTITEYPVTGEGYTTSNTVDAAASTGDGASATSTGSVTVANDDAVVFTNDRDGTVPTGILMDVAPYALIVAFAGIALLLLLGKRKAVTR